MSRRAGSEDEDDSGRRGRSPAAVLGIAATAVGLISSVVGLVLVVRPDLQPEPPARAKSVHLRELDFESRVTRRQYLQRFDLPTTSFRATDLRAPGAFLEYRYEINGYKGDRLPVKYELIDARTGDEAKQGKPFLLEAVAPEDAGTWHAWVPYPNRTGSFY